MNPPDRYHRQTLLPQITPQGQSKLSQSRLLLIGCGALGSTLAPLLVRAGIGFLRIVDRDLVETSNLQRQILFTETDAHDQTPKAIAAARELRRANSSVTIEPIIADVNPHNIASLAGLDEKSSPIHLILDGTDNVATRYLINDLAVKHNLPWVYGACVGVVGRVMAIRPGVTPCLRCLFPDPPKADELPTCDIAGVLGPAAAAVASLQASLAMRLLLDPDFFHPSTNPGLLTLDLWSAQFRSLKSAQPQPDCPCCADRQFPFLSTSALDFTTTLCGRNAVQLTPPNASADLESAAHRLAAAGTVLRNPYFVRCRLNENPAITLTLFADGRLIVQGTTESARARSLYARYIGT